MPAYSPQLRGLQQNDPGNAGKVYFHNFHLVANITNKYLYMYIGKSILVCRFTHYSIPVMLVLSIHETGNFTL